MGRTALRLLPLLLLCPLSGCVALAAIGAKTNYTTITPSYTGFANQSVGVMAWADDATRFEHDALVLDVTHGISAKLQGAQARNATELKGTTFPRSAGPDAVYAFQSNHPEAAAEPIIDVAPRLGVSRLIYVEISNFNLHSGAVQELARGNLSGTVQVVEVSGRNAKVVFSDSVQANFPEQSPDEGMPGLADRDTYIGTVDSFCTAVVGKFVSHPAEQGHK